MPMWFGKRSTGTLGSCIARRAGRSPQGVRILAITGWTRSLFSLVFYEFAVVKGDLGSAEGHRACFEIGLRF